MGGGGYGQNVTEFAWEKTRIQSKKVFRCFLQNANKSIYLFEVTKSLVHPIVSPVSSSSWSNLEQPHLPGRNVTALLWKEVDNIIKGPRVSELFLYSTPSPFSGSNTSGNQKHFTHIKNITKQRFEFGTSI